VSARGDYEAGPRPGLLVHAPVRLAPMSIQTDRVSVCVRERDTQTQGYTPDPTYQRTGPHTTHRQTRTHAHTHGETGRQTHYSHSHSLTRSQAHRQAHADRHTEGVPMKRAAVAMARRMGRSLRQSY
jgi:hypothetical protein